MIKTIDGYQGLNVNFENDRRLHLELGTRCTLMCSGCARTQLMQRKMQGLNTYEKFRVTDIGMDNIRHLLRPENRIKFLHISSVFSDPIYCGHLFETLEYINQLNPRPRLQYATNASGKPPKWWIKFANTFRHRDKIDFSIDGLEDTNHLYRVNADWNSIYNGMVTFLNEIKKMHIDVDTTWKFIVFQHNQHQIAEAYKLSKELGFKSFKLIKAAPRTPKTLQPTKTWSEISDLLNDARKKYD